MSKTTMTYTPDQKAVVRRELESAFGSMATLLDWLENDKLTTDMRESLPNLIDMAMNQVKSTIGHTGEENERVKEMTESIGAMYQRQINDLQTALREQGSIGSLAANTKMLFGKIDKWWDIEGFNYSSEKSIGEYGCVNIKLGFMLNSFTSRYSTTPVSDTENLKTKTEYLREQGFEFTPSLRDYDLDLIDNDTNRKLLDQLIKRAFPSAKIWSVENRLRRTQTEDDECLIIRSLDVTIQDIADVENLIIEDKQFLEDDQ